ncbi:MAG: ribonuclease III [Pirellulales bacterium]
MSAEDELASPDQERLAACQERLGYQFKSIQLLQSALTHSSGATHKLGSNERLEFLGDAILGAIVCDVLFHNFPRLLEGDLTKIKSDIVSRKSCANYTRELGLERFLMVGKGMGNPERVPRSLLADLFESLIAAIYLDGGMPAATEFVQRAVRPLVHQAAEQGSPENYKSLLQQKSQRELGTTPTYEMVAQRGPDHNKCFKISAVIGRKSYPPAWGRSKKEAQQRAACNALSELKGELIPYPADQDPLEFVNLHVPPN